MMAGDNQSEGIDLTVERREVDVRQAIETQTQKDLRAGEERREPFDRRGIHVNLDNPSEEFVETIITWLMGNAGEGWNIGQAENEPEESDVTWRVKFDRQSDKDSFLIWLHTLNR